MKYNYKPVGVCPGKFEIVAEDGILIDLRAEGGCSGNLQGLSSVIKGRPINEVADLLEGIRCNGRVTSCPDQISKALKDIFLQNEY